MSGRTLNAALTQQTRTPGGMTDRARNLIQKRERQIAALKGENARLRALAGAPASGRMQEVPNARR